MQPKDVKAPKVDKTGEMVAENITFYRKRAGHTMRSLSEDMKVNGRIFSHTTISQIENKQRRVDVDELVLLATYLDTSVMALLTPHNEHPDEEVGSAIFPHETAKAVLYRTYRDSPYFPEWVREDIEIATGSAWRNMYDSIQGIEKMLADFPGDKWEALEILRKKYNADNGGTSGDD